MAERRRQQDATKAAWDRQRALFKGFKSNFSLKKADYEPNPVTTSQKKLDDDYD